MDRENELPEPWYWTEDDVSGQLTREISRRHPLYGVKAKTVARRGDNDDVLFRITDHESEFAVVHLTWSGNSHHHRDGYFPDTKLYKDWEDVYINCILKDSKEFEKDNEESEEPLFPDQ